MNRTKAISKLCSYLLRHKPEEANLDMDENGWVSVDQLLANCGETHFEFSFEELQNAVDSNDKKRFTFNDDKTKIRANQGHSIEVNVELEPIEPPEFLYHGTAEKYLESILKNGLLKQNRLHVHLTENKETAKAVGSRHGKPVIIEISSGVMSKAGIPFYKSKNGVWLTNDIETKYLNCDYEKRSNS